jgi:hypothetical protein
MPTVSAVQPKTPDLYEVDAETGEVKLNFHSGQWRAWDATERFVITLAGSQGGKTSLAAWWLLREITNRGPGDYLIAAPSFALMAPKILPTFLAVFQQLMKLGKFVTSPVMKFTFSDEACKSLWGDEWDPDGPKTCVYFGHAQKPDSLECHL